LTAIGDACTGVCRVGEGQTGKEVGECLAKRVEVVVCKLGEGEVASASSVMSSRVASSTGSSAGSTRSASASASRSASASTAASQSASAGNAVGVVNVAHSKVGAVVFGMLAMGAFAGMML
jgi:hypothetical protein